MNRDPICGREINIERTLYDSEFGGQVYYFCSKACKEQFDRNPAVYARQHAA